MKTTRTLIPTALTLAALTTGVWAQTETASSAAPTSGTAPAATAPPAVTVADIQALRDALAAQQRQIEALQAQLQGKGSSAQAEPSVLSGPSVRPPVDLAPTPSSDAKPSDSASTVAALPQQTGQNAGSSDERIRNLERQLKGIGPISFSGDVRLRAEPIFGGPSDQSLDRARARIRARFNAVASLGEQFRAGLTLASGDVNDPTTTNQTLTGFYTRKTVALDQAFVEFTPKEFKPLTLTGGKFRYPWYNTELTWDKDLNPEGAAETL
ncbi:MAG TPA: putative porin, partial [Candidatus Sulfotelmatobacter sp.]|nr:putative porin [Candidatus Sulfotelmatobacter sp.]